MPEGTPGPGPEGSPPPANAEAAFLQQSAGIPTGEAYVPPSRVTPETGQARTGAAAWLEDSANIPTDEVYAPPPRAASEAGSPAQPATTAAMGTGEKPTNDRDAVNRWRDASAEKFHSLTPEQKADIGRFAREYIKQVVGVTDTADLIPQARMTYEALWQWLTSKEVR